MIEVHAFLNKMIISAIIVGFVVYFVAYKAAGNSSKKKKMYNQLAWYAFILILATIATFH